MSFFSLCISFIFAFFGQTTSQEQIASDVVLSEPPKAFAMSEEALPSPSTLRKGRSLLNNGTYNNSFPCFSLPRTFPYFVFSTLDLPLTTTINVSKNHYFTTLQGTAPTLALFQNEKTNTLQKITLDTLSETLNITLTSANYGTYVLLLVAQNDCGQATQILHIRLEEPYLQAPEEVLVKWCHRNRLGRKIAIPIAVSLPLPILFLFLLRTRKLWCNTCKKNF